jgi:hypothetical protein
VAPLYFAGAFRSSLQSVGARTPAVHAGVDALVDAYQLRDGANPYREPAGADWWHATAFRHAAWSSTLRSLGDWYDRVGNDRLAASYYEAAIGYPYGSLGETWIDLDALLPLAVIYSHGTEPYKLDALVERLFNAKGGAYHDHDVRRERYFHMALGGLFSARGQWGQGPWDVRGAIFQLEAMRRLTPIVARQTGTALRDPPELLEKLVLGYRTLDRASPTEGYGKTALALAREVRSAYLESGQNEDVVRVDSLITTLQRR